MGRRVVLIALAALVLVLLFGSTSIAAAYIDWLWFGEVHLRGVFWRELRAELVVGPALGATFFVLFYGNILAALRWAPRFRLAVGVVQPAGGAVPRAVRRVGLWLSLFIAVMVAFATSGQWLVFLAARYGASFGVADPVFHRDIGFYVFTLPAWRYAYSFVFGTLVAALVATLVTHAIVGGVTARPESGLEIRESTIAHVSALLGAMFVLAGFGKILDAWELLFSSDGVVAGAGYTDVHVRLPALRVLMVIAWVIAIALFVNVRRRKRALPLLALGAWVVALVIALAVVPGAVQSLIVNPDQGSVEAEYIARNIKATRAAYKLDSIKSTKLPLTGDLTAAKLEDNDLTIRNIRLWDPGTLLSSYQQLQELRPYYAFKDVDVDRYKVGGVYRETMISARLMNVAGLPPQAQTWVNRHITYTHGYGVAVSAVNQVTPDGSPDFLVQDIPVTASAPSLAVTQPRIYFGEIGTDYVLVKTREPEFDYPGPNGDAYHAYDGTGGIRLGSFVTKLAFALEYGTIKFFTSSAITGQSRVIIRSDIRQRLAAAAPFLSFDSDPYVVIADGRLYWMADGYTTTSGYPYSQPNGSINYLRNSVKAVIDAYNGSVDFYVFDPGDPLIATYAKIFPGMFKPAAAMPAALADHVRYPEDYFNVQAEMFSTYHVTSPSVFYNKGDQWEIPGHVSISGAGRMQAYYVIMRLPKQSQEEFVLILPFAPNGRSNMIGWLGAESDPPRYGQSVSFAFPASQTVYGPAQVEAVVNQDPTISSQRTLWGQQGSHVIFGNLLVVPVEDSLVYVQPMYIESEQTKLPQFKRVIVFYRSPAGAKVPPSGQQQNVVMEPTLGGALEKIFGAKPEPAPAAAPAPTAAPQPAPASASAAAPAPAPVKTLIDQANREFEDAQTALKAGDFAGYGKHIDDLKQTLKKLEKLH